MNTSAALPPQDNADLPEHDVAVVVFTRVCAVDEINAANIAERAVRQAVRDALKTRYGRNHEPYGELEFRDLLRNFRVPVVVTDVHELGMACGDSYLHVTPTRKAYREEDRRRELAARGPNDTVNTQDPECQECGAALGQAHDPTCSIREEDE